MPGAAPQRLRAAAKCAFAGARRAVLPAARRQRGSVQTCMRMQPREYRNVRRMCPEKNQRNGGRRSRDRRYTRLSEEPAAWKGRRKRHAAAETRQGVVRETQAYKTHGRCAVFCSKRSQQRTKPLPRRNVQRETPRQKSRSAKVNRIGSVARCVNARAVPTKHVLYNQNVYAGGNTEGTMAGVPGTNSAPYCTGIQNRRKREQATENQGEGGSAETQRSALAATRGIRTNGENPHMSRNRTNNEEPKPEGHVKKTRLFSNQPMRAANVAVRETLTNQIGRVKEGARGPEEHHTRPACRSAQAERCRPKKQAIQEEEPVMAKRTTTTRTGRQVCHAGGGGR